MVNQHTQLLSQVRRLRFIFLTLVVLLAVWGTAVAPAGRALELSDPVEPKLAAGAQHSALILQDGSLYLWGNNSYGQTGVADKEYIDRPHLLSWPEPIVAVELGADHTLFLTASGRVYALGRNTFGQLGDGTVTFSDKPVEVKSLPPIAAIACGLYHSLALSTDGAVWGWGDNSVGQLAETPGESILDLNQQIAGYRHTEPFEIIPADVKAIAAGGEFSMALFEDGTLNAWGDNSRGQLGDGSQKTRPEPAAVKGLKHVKAIAAGFQYALAVVSENGQDLLLSWGDNNAGQLGLAAAADSSFVASPQAVTLPREPQTDLKIRLISAGYSHAIAVTGSDISSRQSLFVWGSNAYGQLGLGSTDNQSEPSAITFARDGYSGSSFLPFTQVAAGGNHTLVLSSLGLAGAAGRGDSGQLGTGSIVHRPNLTNLPVPDLILPGWPQGAKLAIERKDQNEVVLRWPKAQDNIALAGYRLQIERSDGEKEILDLADEQTLTLTAGEDVALQVSVAAFDQAGSALSVSSLSRLSAFLAPAQDPLAPPENYFSQPFISEPLKAENTHAWRPNLTDRPDPLAVAWQVVFDPGQDLPRPPDRLSLIAGGVLSILLLVFVILAERRRRRLKAQPLVRPKRI